MHPRETRLTCQERAEYYVEGVAGLITIRFHWRGHLIVEIASIEPFRLASAGRLP